MNERAIKEQFESIGQEHLFEYWQDREQLQKVRLLEDLASLDVNLLGSMIGKLDESEQKNPDISPVPFLSQKEWSECKEARMLGEQLFSSGKAGFLAVAGGQGSRLGFDAPKGMFPITPIRKASLFQLFAEKIGSAKRKYKVPVYWYIMTNPINHQITAHYFEQNSFFGLAEDEIIFFSQALIPSLTKEGKLILAPDGGLFKNPDGHGGVVTALHRHGLLNDMIERGVEELFYFQVDNPLVNIPDPMFLGVHRARNSEMSSKVIKKAYPEEKLGTIGLVNGKPGVIEYSDLNEKHMYARDTDENLLFSHGSIAIHVLNVLFLSGTEISLPFHRVQKRVKSFVPGPGGGHIEGRISIKFEMFIFDAIPQAMNPIFFETSREEEFSPLKNRTGLDSIETCMQGYTARYARWLELCGVAVPRNAKGQSLYRVEISPLYASDVEELKNRLGDSVNSINEDILFS